MKPTRWVFSVVLLVISASSLAGIRGVPDPYATIQLGIDSSEEGDTVLVEPGVYEECIDFRGKNITVTSVDPNNHQVVADTVIQGDDSGSVVTFAAGEDHRAILSGFTITGGYGSPDPDYDDLIVGAGVYCYRSSPVLRLNIIEDNHAPNTGDGVYGYGGGISCIEANPIMVGNTIRDNSAWRGGGVHCFESSLTLSMNVIAGNITPDGQNGVYGRGGGIYANKADFRATGNVIRDNIAFRGGGMYVNSAETRISSNMIYGNSAKYGGGVVLRSGGYRIELINNTVVANVAEVGANILVDGRSQISNNIIAFGQADRGGGIVWAGGCPIKTRPIAFNDLYGNAGGDYFGVSNQTGRNGNICQDPLFRNVEADDYHLQPDSPAIGAGDPAYVAQAAELDADGDPRLLVGRVDMGADEYEGYVRPIANAGQAQCWDEIPPTVALDGSMSCVHDSGGILQYEWTQVAGPEVQLSAANHSQTILEPTEPGVYCFELLVRDLMSESRPDRVTVVVDAGRLPVAEAGPTVYATSAPVQLDGTGSRSADGVGDLNYQWRQISGPPMVIEDPNTATPIVHAPTRTVGRKEVDTFVQTDQIQLCEFELVVSDGGLMGLPDTTRVVILPDVGPMTMRIENPPFNPGKPTIIYFGGGDGVTGYSGQPWNQLQWASEANVLSFPQGYSRDPRVEGVRTYYKYGAMIMAYLSEAAPEYNQPIQTIGWSTGGQPAIDAAIYMNLAFEDVRYAVNHVTGLDACCHSYSYYRNLLIGSAVDGEQCWADFYWYANVQPVEGTFLGVDIPLSHSGVRDWYRTSVSFQGADAFHHGLVAGAYWSVIGPGKNLQLATTTGSSIYRFVWSGTLSSGHLEFADETLYPGRLPEPVTLVGPIDVQGSNGVILTCQESENVVGYELLLGSDPYRVMDYTVISDGPAPPSNVVTELPYAETWWTVRVRDQHGSTIYADPERLDAGLLSLPVKSSATSGP